MYQKHRVIHSRWFTKINSHIIIFLKPEEGTPELIWPLLKFIALYVSNNDNSNNNKMKKKQEGGTGGGVREQGEVARLSVSHFLNNFEFLQMVFI